MALTHVRAWADQSPEQRAIEAIRTAALVPSSYPDHPLPLVSGWMDGRQPLGFGPQYQIDQIRNGQYLLPWLAVYEQPSSVAADARHQAEFASYYEPAVKYLAEHHLPLCVTTSEWEVIMRGMGQGILGQIPLSPRTPVSDWYAAGQKWAQHSVIRRLQSLYPDPPLVLILPDDEYPRLSATQLGAGYSARSNDQLMARRRALGDSWIDRYRAMLQGFRDGLGAPGWRSHVRIVGFDAFPPPFIGRWPGWIDYTLYVPGRVEPFPEAWDGASVSYYQHDYFPDSDFTVWSPQIEAMNWVAELDGTYRRRPNYWFELSTWDGQQRGQPTDKAQFYASRGQSYSAARYGGMVQFGMWLLRPRVIREFRNPTDDRAAFGPYFQALLAAVARVHDNPTLAGFWRRGRLLPNPSSQHPYQENVPADLAGRSRWYLLDSSKNPTRPWNLSTQIQVFAIALEQGESPHRQWLVYAFTPQRTTKDIDVVIPGGPSIRVTGTSAGAFTLVREDDRSELPLG